MDLMQLFYNHRELPLPKFPKSDEFSEWVEELIEVDSYYVGLVLTYGSSKKAKIDLGKLKELEVSLRKFSSITEDAEVFNGCEEYLRSLQTLLEKFNS